MVMTPVSGEKEHGGFLAEPRSEPAWVYRSGPKSIGASVENGVSTLVGLSAEESVGLSVGTRVGLLVGASVKTGVGTPVEISVYLSEPWSAPWSKTARVYRSELMF